MSDEYSDSEVRYPLNMPPRIDVPEDHTTVEEFVRYELSREMRKIMWMEECYIVHEMLFGVPCGPTLNMVFPPKLKGILDADST